MKKVTIEKTVSGQCIIKVNGHIKRNRNRCPAGVATFGSEQEAREWYEEQKKVA